MSSDDEMMLATVTACLAHFVVLVPFAVAGLYYLDTYRRPHRWKVLLAVVFPLFTWLVVLRTLVRWLGDRADPD